MDRATRAEEDGPSNDDPPPVPVPTSPTSAISARLATAMTSDDRRAERRRIRRAVRTYLCAGASTALLLAAILRGGVVPPDDGNSPPSLLRGMDRASPPPPPRERRRRSLSRRDKDKADAAAAAAETERHQPAEDGTGDGDYSSHSCESIFSLTDPSVPGMRCAFARTCNGGDGIYAPVTFCHPSRSPRALALALSVPLLLLMSILFRILGSTAEEFFSPGLEMFSLRMGLPERFAGVTLLALGNGAPDVASTVNAILDDPKKGYLLAMGELTGAAMVIGTVVAGAVAWVAPGGKGVQCGGALVRDVIMFVLTMAVAYWSLEDGSVSLLEVWTFAAMYLGYVLVVLAADLYHRNVVEPRDREERRRRRRERKEEKRMRAKAAGPPAEESPRPGETTRLLPLTDDENAAADDDAAELQQPPYRDRGASLGTYELTQKDHKTNILHRDRGVSIGSYELAHPAQGGAGKKATSLERVIEAISNYDERSNEDEEEGTEGSESDLNGRYGPNGHAANSRMVPVNFREGPPYPPPGPLYTLDSCSSCLSNKEAKRIEATPSGWARKVDPSASEPLIVFHPRHYHPHHGGVMNISPPQRPPPHPAASFDELSTGGASTVTECAQHPCAGEAARDWREAWTGCWGEFVDHWLEFWREMYHCEEGGWMNKALLTCELPFTVVRKLTIPIPCDGYYSRPLVALSMALSPLWLVFYFRTQFDLDLLRPMPDSSSAGRAVPALLLLLPLFASLLVVRLAPSGDVPMRTSVSVPITLWGFLISASWLDLIADQLVGILSYFGVVCRIPSTIMGLTVLAWGNSLQDMLANITVARRGLSNMAITACFAGPIFNMLVGLGVGFAALLGKTSRTSVPVRLTPPLRMGFLFSALNGAAVIVTGTVFGRGTIPRGYGYAALALYGAYAVASLAFQ